MIRLKQLGHVLLRVADLERSKRFYVDVLGFQVSEANPGDAFLTLGNDFHTLDLVQHANPAAAPRPQRDQIGLSHIAFQVDGYEALRAAYLTLQEQGVAIDSASDHVSQRSVYFADPDGNRLEIYYEIPNARTIFAAGRDDRDEELPLSQPGEPPPAWLLEDWPQQRVAATP
jgi:catechol 2,3-dioxygenase